MKRSLLDWARELLRILNVEALHADVKMEKMIYAAAGIPYLKKGSGSAAGIDEQFAESVSEGIVRIVIDDPENGPVGPLEMTLSDLESFVETEGMIQDLQKRKDRFFEDGTDEETVEPVVEEPEDLSDIASIVQETLHGIVERGRLKEWTQRIARNAAMTGGDPELVGMVVNQAKAVTGLYNIHVRKGFNEVLDRVLTGLLRALFASLPKGF